jgi:hypothetical protein
MKCSLCRYVVISHVTKVLPWHKLYTFTRYIIRTSFQVPVLSGTQSLPPHKFVLPPCYCYHQWHNFRIKFSESWSAVQMLKWVATMTRAHTHTHTLTHTHTHTKHKQLRDYISYFFFSYGKKVFCYFGLERFVRRHRLNGIELVNRKFWEELIAYFPLKGHEPHRKPKI